MVRGRKYDEALVELFAKGQVPGMWYSGIGNEAVGAGVVMFLRPEDWVEGYHRGFTWGLSKGYDSRAWLAGHLRRAAGINAAELRRRLHMLPQGGTIGSCFPKAAGAAMAAKRLDTGEVVVCLFGDGASQRGTLHECFNLAVVWKLPVVWVCENNLYSITTPVKKAVAAKDVADLARGYNMPGLAVDGQDVLGVAESAMLAIDRARRGDGPSLVECKSYRYREHGEGDIPTPYRTKDEVEAWMKHDPIALFRERLVTGSLVSRKELDAIDASVSAEVSGAAKWALEQPLPKPGVALDEYTHVTSAS